MRIVKMIKIYRVYRNIYRTLIYMFINGRSLILEILINIYIHIYMYVRIVKMIKIYRFYRNIYRTLIYMFINGRSLILEI